MSLKNKMTRSGVVVSNKTEKTVVVRVERVFQHALYDRTVKQSKKLMAHDESNELKIGDKVKIVRFGDPKMSIKKDQPARRKSFRARHKCSTAKDKTTPRYWSCTAW